MTNRSRSKAKRSRLFLYAAVAIALATMGWWFIVRLRAGEAHKVAHTFLKAIQREDASAILQICHPEEREALSLREEDILPTLRALRAWFFGNGARTSMNEIAKGKRDWQAVLLREEASGKRTRYHLVIYNTRDGLKIRWTNTVLGFADRAIREELRPRYPALAAMPPSRGSVLRQLIEERAIQWGIRRVWMLDGEIRTLPSPPY
jgi:hypothetical protein